MLVGWFTHSIVITLLGLTNLVLDIYIYIQWKPAGKPVQKIIYTHTVFSMFLLKYSLTLRNSLRSQNGWTWSFTSICYLFSCWFSSFQILRPSQMICTVSYLMESSWGAWSVCDSWPLIASMKINFFRITILVYSCQAITEAMFLKWWFPQLFLSKGL